MKTLPVIVGRMEELNINQKALKILTLCLVVLLTACSNNRNSIQELKTVEKITDNILSQGLLLSLIDIPEEIISTEAVEQVGYEIGDSGDKVFIYEYKDNKKTLQTDSTTIHNNLNRVTQANPPLLINGQNISIIYMKKEKNNYEIENKILKVL